MITNHHSEAAQFLDDARYDWTKPEAMELHEILLQAYSTQGRADLHLAKSGVDRAEIQMGQPMRSLWKQALEVAATGGKTRKLVELARQDFSVAAFHPRLERLLGPQPRPSESPAAVSALLPWAGNELITGAQETFLEMSFFHEGLRVAASVVRLLTQTKEGKSFSGTGFLVAPDTILTNHHVLFDGRGRPVEQVEIWFNYELDAGRRPREVDRYECNVSTILGDSELDWAVIRSAKPVKGSYPIFDIRPSKPARKDDFVFIIQHPGGRMKQIGILHNQVVNVTDRHVQYLTDTLGGSSGAPVCNEHWEVVALHHQGVPAGAESDTFHKNQGVRIERVREGLIARGVLKDRPA